LRRENVVRQSHASFLRSPNTHNIEQIIRLMNSKPIVWAVFAVWSLVCWRWYVCGIMDACKPAPSTENAVTVDSVPNPAIEPEETAVVPQPIASDPTNPQSRP
jgi:hypothetical protein